MAHPYRLHHGLFFVGPALFQLVCFCWQRLRSRAAVVKLDRLPGQPRQHPTRLQLITSWLICSPSSDRRRLRCRVRAVGTDLHSTKTSMRWRRRHCRRIGWQQMHRGHPRFGPRLILECRCRRPIHFQTQLSSMIPPWLVTNDSIRRSSVFSKAAAFG